MATIPLPVAPPPKPCLRGVLKKQGDHLVSIKGRWAMNKADFDKDVRKLTSVFEYRRDSAFTGAEAVGLSHLSGRYVGFINVKKQGNEVKITEHGLTISLTSLNDSKYKVQAKGGNVYGVFEMQGTAKVSDANPDDLEIELFRDYTGPPLNRPKGPRGRGNKRSGSSLKGDRPGIKRSKQVAQKEPRSSSITPMPETSRGGEGGDAGHSNGHSKKYDSNAKPRSSPAKSLGSVGTSSQNGSREPLQSVQNGSRSVPPLERPKMSGTMFRDETGAVIMKGRWWLSEHQTERAQSSGFEYKLSDQGPDRAKHLPASGLYDGYFVIKLYKGAEKVHEKGLNFHFTPSVSGSDGTYDISASGQNTFGRFAITGNARRKSNGKEVEFDIYRVYTAQASVPAQKPPAARPAKLHKGDRAKDREKGAVRSGQAAQKEPRSATTPPPSSRDGEVAQRQRRVPAKLVDDPTVTGGRQRIRGLAQRFMEILRHLKSKPEAYYFLMPVDPVKLNIPTYFAIIKRPMDLGTIVKRVNSYENIDAICADIRLIFDNAVKFNFDENGPVHKAAVKLRAIFENKLEEVKAKIREDELAEERMEIEDREQTRLKKKASKKTGRKSSSIGGAANGSGSGGPADAAQMQQMFQMQEKMMEMQETIKKLQRQTSSHQVQLGFEGDGEDNAELEEAKKELLNSTPLTYDEKASLSKKIEKLPVTKLNRVIEIIQQQMELSGLQADNEIELEIDQLSTPTLRQLQAYVAECTKKPGAKAGAGGAGKAPRGGKGVKKAEGRRSPPTSGKSKSKQSATKSKGGKGSKSAKSKGEPASSAKAEKGDRASTSCSSSLGSEYLALVNRAAEAHPDPVLNSHSAPLHGVKADLGNAAPQDTDASTSEPAMATMASWERPNAEIDGECTSSSEDDSDDDDDAAAPLAFKKSSKPAAGAAATEGSAATASGGSSSMDEKAFSKPDVQSAVPKPSPIIQTAAVLPPEESGFIKPEPVLAAVSQPPPSPSSTVAETPQPLPLPPVAVVAAREDSDDDDDGIDEQAWSSGWTAAVDPVADTEDGAQDSKRPRADSDGSVSSNWKKMRSELDQRDIRERDRQIQEQEMLRAKELADQRTHEEALAEANRQIQEKEAAEQCRREEIEAQRLAEQQKILDARELERRKRNETQQTVDLNPFDVEGEFGDLTT